MIGSSAQGMTSSEICLRCHSASAPKEHHVATSPVPPIGIAPASLTPGGDFAYLLKHYSWTDFESGTGSSPGERHGHNIVAPSYGYSVDSKLATAPGGTYPAAGLSCVSCHDPHGNYRLIDQDGTFATEGPPIVGSGSYGEEPTAVAAVGTYRLLAGKGYRNKSAGHIFLNDPPVAVAPRHYNRPENITDVRVAYGKGSAEWCLNCHAHISNNSHAHVSGVEMGGTIATNYNRYKKSGDLTGNDSNAFSSLVPFQSGTATNVQQLVAVTKTFSGPRPDDKVMCLTCHRAHASPWDSMTRWNTKGTFLVADGSYPGTDATGKGSGGRNAAGKTKEEYRKAMYGRDPATFAYFQRSLCNKCHPKD